MRLSEAKVQAENDFQSSPKALRLSEAMSTERHDLIRRFAPEMPDLFPGEVNEQGDTVYDTNQVLSTLQREQGKMFPEAQAFEQGVLPLGKTAEERTKLVQEHPIATAVGQFAGLAGTISATGGLGAAVTLARPLAAVPLLARIAGGRIANSTLLNVGLGKMTQLGSGFFLKALSDEMAELVSGDKKTFGEVVNRVADQAVLGVGFGAAGTFANPLVRLPAEAVYGFTAAKVHGANNLEAGLNSALILVLGSIGAKNYNTAYGRQSMAAARRAFVDKMESIKVKPEAAQAAANRYFSYLDRLLLETKGGKFRTLNVSDYDAISAKMREPWKQYVEPVLPPEELPKPEAKPQVQIKAGAVNPDFVARANAGEITPEITQNVNEIIAAGGGEILPKGSLTKGQPAYGEPAQVYFNDPMSKSTMILPIDQLTPEAVKAKIEAKQAEFSSVVKPEEQALIEEAKKYKSVEEFINSKTLYHGTNQEFENFKVGGETGAQGTTSKYGIWFTASKEEAQQYADISAKRNIPNQEQHEAKIRVLLKRAERAEAKGDYDLADKLNSQAEIMEANAKKQGPTGQRIVEAYVDLKNPMVVDAGVKGFDQEEVILKAKNNGNDGVIFKNIKDTPFGMDKPTTQYLVFSPENLKTKYQLTDIWNKAHAQAQPVAKIPDMTQESMPAEEKDYSKYVNYANSQKQKQFKKSLSSVGEFIDKSFVPLSTRASKVGEDLRIRLRRFEYSIMENTKKDYDMVSPFLKKANKIKGDDSIILDVALKNRDIAKVEEIAKKYGAEKEYAQIKTTLKDIYTRAKDAGLDVNYLEDYFPRRVKDVEGFLNYLRGTEQWSAIQEEVSKKEKELGYALDDDSKAEYINLLLRGYGESKINVGRPSNIKARKIDVITPEMNEFYKDSKVALTEYITAMNNAIETANLLGKDPAKTEESIGSYVNRLIEDNVISRSQEKEVRNILAARIGKKGTHGVWQLYKNMSYVYTMGSPISAITQIGDLYNSLYKNGVYNTFTSLTKSLTGNAQVTKEDLGISAIAEEFLDSTKTGKAVTKVFKTIGLDFMDNVGKSTLIQSSLQRLQQEAVSNKAGIEQRLEQIFGGRSGQVLNDLKEGKITDDVKYLLFSELSDFQPISLSEMPEYYVNGGNLRIFYMLKSYTLKLLDVYHNEVFRQMKTDPIKGGKNLLRLTIALMLTGITADTIKDVLLGRKIDLPDMVIDNILKLMGFSKWQIYKAREDGLMTTFMQSILPPVPLLDDVYKDIVKKEEFPNWRTLNSVPYVGKFYYWWFGGGRKKENKKRSKGVKW